MTDSRRANKLVAEKSPYLLQHAYNPVDWYPWGQEAFDLAILENKPIFLSIGYSTCHWCHVMEKESFEDEKTASILNKTFINIKVDREELPDVDSMYMDMAQVLMSSAGGWPLNVILTPDLKPFFAITYMPARARHGVMGLEEFAQQISDIWSSDEKEVLIEQAQQLFAMFEKTAVPKPGEISPKAFIKQAIECLLNMADPYFGGFKGEPKFPLSFQASLLLEYGKMEGDSRALFFAINSLDKMLEGGIYDHIGGGFARYAVDEMWRIPHFEKMLYDNAGIAKTYFEAWKLTKNPKYKKVCEQICTYISRDMTDPLGGFYSAEDADSEGEEGKFYTWTLDEICEVLSPEDAGLFCEFYGVSLQGNFEGKNVLYLKNGRDALSDDLRLNKIELETRIQNCREKLLQVRQKRVRPFIDDKIITSWNGLMIDSLVKIGSAFNRKEWVDAALKAAEFIQGNCYKEGKLCRRYRDGEARFIACLDDYAFIIKGYLSLFEEGLGEKWLKIALDLSTVLEEEYKTEEGAFYFSSGKEPQVKVRKCEFYDGAEPSGNAVHAENLLRLYQITAEDKYITLAEDILRAAKDHMDTYPPGSCYSIRSLMRYYNTEAPTLVIAIDKEGLLKEEIAREIHDSYSPHLQVVWLDEGSSALKNLLPFMAEKKTIDGQTAVYLCSMKGCQPPMLELGEISKAIQDL